MGSRAPLELGRGARLVLPPQVVIDLSDVTLIDDSGEGLLGELRGEGAELVARGMYTKHLIENIKSKEKQAFRR